MKEAAVFSLEVFIISIIAVVTVVGTHASQIKVQ